MFYQGALSPSSRVYPIHSYYPQYSNMQNHNFYPSPQNRLHPSSNINSSPLISKPHNALYTQKSN